MSPVVRVVGIQDVTDHGTDADHVAERVADRIGRLPAGIDATVVSTRGGLLITLSSRPARRPGARRRAIRMMQAELARLIG